MVISGTGEFFGEDAYEQWNSLVQVFKENGPGSFTHPIYTDVTTVLMTKLSSDLEPRENYVKYSFEFVEHNKPTSTILGGGVNKVSTKSTSTSNAGGTILSGNIKNGDIVVCNGKAYYDSYGSQPSSKPMVDKTVTVTNTNFKGSHPIHVGSIGWMKLSDVKLKNGNISNTKTTSHVVKSGETLSKIASKYKTTWKELATYNNIKDPNKIYVGQVIKIGK